MLIERMLARFYQDEAGGGDGAAGAGGAAGSGAAAGAGAAGAGGAGDGGAGAAAGAGDAAGGAGAGAGGAEKTLLEKAGAGDGAAAAAAASGAELTAEQKALQASEKDTRRPAAVPAKYWDATKGEVNYEAWAKSTNTLESRMRDVGLPPKSADEYKFEVPKALKDLGVDLDPAMSKGFRDAALGLGLTQKQYEGVMGAYFSHASGLADQASQLSETKARADLLGYYKTEEALTSNLKLAYRAFDAYTDENDKALINQIGNIPAVIRVLAKVGKELGEDPGVSPDAILDSESVETLMRGRPGQEDSPYWNTDDPRHKATVARVMKHHEASAAARQRRAA